MAELNQNCHLPSQFCRSEEEIARMLQNFSLRDELIRPQKPIGPPSTNFFRASPSSSSSSPYFVYQNHYSQNRSPINGGFPSQSWNNGGFSSPLWNTVGNAVDNVDWSYCDTPCKFVNPYALPSIGNYERVARINSPVLSWNDYSYPITRINSSVPIWSTSSSTTTIPTTLDMKKEELEAYNKRKIIEFKNYLKLKGWTEEHIQFFEWCDDPILLHEYYGLDIRMMCMNQLGSQYLRRDSVMESATAIILDAVLKGIFQIIIDPNGNYVFQRLLNDCSQEQLQKIVYALTKRDVSKVFIDAIMTEYGTKSIQKLISTLRSLRHKLINNVINSLKPHVKELMLNRPGRKLIEHCMQILKYGQTQFIYSEVIPNWLELARHKEGYHVVSKAIETVQDPMRMKLLTEVTDHALHLAQEPNGNFVIQKVISLENPTLIDKLCINLEEKIVPLSKHKHGSHVIEKCLETSAVEFVVRKILKSNSLITLARDQFGNYVIQKALENLKNKRYELHMELVNALRRYSKLLLDHRNGRRVLKRMGELENTSP